jgi:antitoxin HicB
VKYAVDLTPDDNGTILVTSRDVAGATFGETVDEALLHGLELIESALMAKISARETISPPRGKGLHYVELPALSVAKVKLHNAMLEQKIRKADLARLLSWKPAQVDRLLNLNHGSRLDQLEQAFRALGKRLDIAVKDAA